MNPNPKKSDLITIIDLDGQRRHYIITDVAHSGYYDMVYSLLLDPEEEVMDRALER